jgi:cell division protein FtsB
MDKKPPLRRKRIKKREKPLVLVLYISFWVVIVVMFVGFFISQAGEYNELNAELTRLNLDVERARNQVENLQTQYAMFDSDLYIERLARNRGMVRPGEMVFRNIAD